jgi:hypothetical protein
VSLTVDDELNRWQKYSYGCNELIFNPLVSWFKIGPITKQLRVFLWSGAPVHYKISMMGYMFSYCQCLFFLWADSGSLLADELCVSQMVSRRRLP